MEHSFDTELGIVTVVEEDGFVTGLRFGGVQASPEVPSELLAEAESQIREYLSGGRRAFSLPVRYDIGSFGNDILDAMRGIPYGETMTYGELALSSGHPNAFRAAGTACGRNPIPIIIPCHRVVPSSGGIGGYAFGSNIKKRLLEIESEQ